MQPIIIKEKEYLSFFRTTLYLKCIGALGDIVNGIFIWFVSKAFIITFVLNLLHNELSDDPKDVIANFIVNTAESFSVSSQYFLGVYLFLHGIIKLFLVINLFRRKIWAYPVSIVVFTLLIFYQIYEYSFTHSIWLLAFTILDIIVVLLTGHEYGVLKKKLKKQDEKIL